MWPTNKKHWMLTRHTRLTKEQEERFPAVCEKWRRIALSTEPSDRKKAEAAVHEIYRHAGAKRPTLIWLNHALEYTERLSKSIAAINGKPTIPRHRIELRRDEAHLGAARYYKETLVNEIETNIARVVPVLPPILNFQSIWGPLAYGASTARQFALMDFLNTPRHQEYGPFLAAAKVCHSFVPFSRVALLFERPLRINVDAAGRLHNYDAPAVLYRGAKPRRIIFRCCFHGVDVDRKWTATPADEIDFADILKEENTSIRAALLGKYGLERMLKNLKYRTVSKMKGNALLEFVIPGIKWESAEKPGVATIKMRVLHLKWKDKTGERETLLPVPRLQSQFGADRPANCDSAEQVRRWTLGWPKEALAIAET
jgi:hypothetical protein